MDTVLEKSALAPPATYEDWLNCFDMLKTNLSSGSEITAVTAKGTFTNQGYIAGQFRQKLAETITVMIDSRISRFVKDLNTLISFNELSDIAPLFYKLRNELRNCLFFVGFDFLDETFKRELEQSVITQTAKFWNDTVSFLYRQALEYSNPGLEDALFLIRRIKLFE